MNFQMKHWFDAAITLRWINWLVAQFPIGLRIGLVWDQAPQHNARSVCARLRELEESGRLFTATIPSGMTSILQLGVLSFEFNSCRSNLILTRCSLVISNFRTCPQPPTHKKRNRPPPLLQPKHTLSIYTHNAENHCKIETL